MTIAPPHKRFFAFLVDLFVYFVIFALVGRALQLPQNQSIVANVVFAAYVLISWVGFDGATIGKKIAKIKVVSGRGGPIDLWSSIVRLAAYIVSFAVFGLGFAAILGRDHLGWHDLIANTQVVENA